MEERTTVQQQPWSAPFVASQAVIMSLAEVYFEVVYPIFPFFHQPTFLRKLSRGEHNSDQRLFSTTMALCALASARVRDQALFNMSHDMDELTEVPSEVFYESAIKSSVDSILRAPQNFNSLRTCALLSLTAVQYGRIRDMQAFLGKYHTYVAMDGLQDEANWPPDIGIVEAEERRRLVRYAPLRLEADADQFEVLVYVHIRDLCINRVERYDASAGTTS